MTVQPRLGVVIPTWNDAAPLGRTLEALAQLPAEVQQQLEIVVADGGSADGTLEVLARHSGLLHHVTSQPDRGVYDAMNRGVSTMNATWVWFLGAGDCPLIPGLTKLLDHLNTCPEETGQAFAVRASEPREPGVPGVFEPKWGSSLTWRNTLHHQGLVVPKSWLLVTPFDPSFRVLGDYAWLLDMRAEGRTFQCHPEITLAEVPGGGLSRQFNAALYREEWRVKRTRFIGRERVAQLAWLPAKWAFKLVSKAFKISGSSTPQ
ncbi:MAG: glycosyltransferase [Flavobacteriales bacterium]